VSPIYTTLTNFPPAFLLATSPSVHAPPYKIGIGTPPSFNNIQALNTEYYSQALQVLIEAAELLLDEGLGVPRGHGAQFDLDGLLRMDSALQMDVLEKSKGKLTVNEQRRRLNMPKVTGGDTVYLQEQDHSLEWLARRDALPIEGDAEPTPPAADPEPRAAPPNTRYAKSLFRIKETLA
jgi:phage portal protein BeeE